MTEREEGGGNEGQNPCLGLREILAGQKHRARILSERESQVLFSPFRAWAVVYWCAVVVVTCDSMGRTHKGHSN